jgi:hypothetical protein
MAKLTAAKRNSLPLRTLQAPTAILALQAAPNQKLGYYGRRIWILWRVGRRSREPQKS